MTTRSRGWGTMPVWLALPGTHCRRGWQCPLGDPRTGSPRMCPVIRGPDWTVGLGEGGTVLGPPHRAQRRQESVVVLAR